MDFLEFSILNALVKEKKFLSFGQIKARVMGYKDGLIQGALIRLERDKLIASQQETGGKIYTLAFAGLEAYRNYLYASRDITDTAGIE